MAPSFGAEMTDAEFARYPSLRERAVVVTGGASGIGASIVAHFAEQGARVGSCAACSPGPRARALLGLRGARRGRDWDRAVATLLSRAGER
jgi:NAD(P)-dependent dehydrogenase (short-subunit alcohol dehydrogenase family)